MPIKPENRTRYGKGWAAISRRIRFERAGGRCECTGQCGDDHGGRCKAEHNKPHPVTGSNVILTTMHLDHVIENMADDNLMAGCQKCHLKYDAGHHAKNAAATRAAKKQRQLDKAGQLGFLTAIFGPSIA